MPALIPKLLEAKLIDALTEALAAASVSAGISGTWQTSGAGLVRWLETSASADQTPTTTHAAHVSVAVGTSVPKTYTAGDVRYSAQFTVFVRPSLDPTGEIFAAVAAVVDNMLLSWQAQTYQQAFTALDLPDVFAVGDIEGAAGDPPAIANNLATASWPFTISGSLCDPAEESSSSPAHSPQGE